MVLCRSVELSELCLVSVLNGCGWYKTRSVQKSPGRSEQNPASLLDSHGEWEPHVFLTNSYVRFENSIIPDHSLLP